MSIATAFAGFLGQDSELRYTQGGMAVLSFSVATTHYEKGAENNRATQWVKCSMFGKRGESMQPHLVKGSSVFVRGTLKLNKFTNRDGVEVSGLDVVVDDVEFVGGKSGAQAPRGDVGGQRRAPSQGAQQQVAARPAPAGPADDFGGDDRGDRTGPAFDDLPF